MDYSDLDKHFNSPKVISPFYGRNIRIPRKLKKKVKAFVGDSWGIHTKAECLWWYLEHTNTNYKRFLIKQICKQ